MQKKTKIVLLGYMTSGKTAVGKILAAQLNYKFIDLDVYIEKKLKMSIPQIFESFGEDFFRKKEKKYVKKLLKKEKTFVLALGGGTPMGKGIMRHINAKSLSIYLKANSKTLYNRLVPKEMERPLLTNLPDDFLLDYIESLLTIRKKKYEKASFYVCVDDKSIREIVVEIIKKIEA